MSALALAAALFFDDFSQPDTKTLAAQGWLLRSQAGHPGVPGAKWDPRSLALLDDPDQRGNRLLRLYARTDGTPEGTVQSQLCRTQQLLWGTTSARLRFSGRQGGDPVVQAFFQVSPLRFDYDPLFSELDWEFLPNGGWGAPETRLYGIAWQTVRLEPWDAHNRLHQAFEDFGGRWVQLTVQSMPDGSRWFIDGREFAFHAGRTVPRQAMALAISHWVSPGGLQAAGEPRHYAFEVDWVLHVQGEALAPTAMLEQVLKLRAQGETQRDELPPATAPARCDF